MGRYSYDLYDDDYKPRRSGRAGGIGFTGLLTIAFIVLKLTKVINWSWWWVLAPIWISTAISLIVIIIGVLIAHFNN